MTRATPCRKRTSTTSLRYLRHRYSDRTDPTLPDEEVTLDLSDVPPGDLPLVKPGAVFYWSIGYADYPGVPRARQSRIYFRRIAGWTDTELENSKREAHRLAERFTFD